MGGGGVNSSHCTAVESEAQVHEGLAEGPGRAPKSSGTYVTINWPAQHQL